MSVPARARRGGAALFASAGLLALPATAPAFGPEAHRLVNEKAATTLPEPLRELFEGNTDYLRAHSVDPDLWTADRPDEERNHHLSLDSFDDLASGTIPRSEREHLRRHETRAEEGGRLPWRVGEVYDELVSAFRTRDVSRVLERAAVLGHYVADGHGPLHAVADVGGRDSGQEGLLARWETDLVRRFERQIRLRVRPGGAQPQADPVALSFSVLRESLARVDDLLEADRAAAGEQDFAETPHDDRYDDGYYSRLFEREGEDLAARLSSAAQTAGSLWLSAWQAAGRPTLDWSFRVPHVRGRTRLVVALLEGVGAELVEEAAARGALPHLDALRQEAAVGRLRPPFPARGPAAQATLWTGAWPDRHGVVGDGASRPGGSVLETSLGDRLTALAAEPLWLAAAREGVSTVVVDVPQALPLGDDGSGAGLGPHLVHLGHDATGLEPAVLGASDLVLRPASSWTGGKPGPSAREVELPLGGTTLPGLFYDDPEDPTSGLDTLALSETRDLSTAEVLKPAPAGREEDAFAVARLRTADGPLFVHVRLFALSPDGREVLIWHSGGARTTASTERVESAVAVEEGLLREGSHRLYTAGALGRPLLEGGDGTAERRYLETVRLAVRQHTRVASFALGRMRWGLAVLRLPFLVEPQQLWAGRLDPTRPGHDPALAVRLRPFLDEALRLADSWLGDVARRVPDDAALVLVGDRGLGGADRVARPNVALEAAGLLKTNEDGTVDLAQTKVVYSPANGGFLLLNRDSRPGGVQPPKGEPLVRARSIAAMKGIVDPSTGSPAIAALLVPGDRNAPPGIGGPPGGFLYLRPAPGVVLSTDTRGPVVETIATRGEAFDPSAPSAAGLLVLAGRGVAGGRSLGDVAMVDVAPTITSLLGLATPRRTQGTPIERALRASQAR